MSRQEIEDLKSQWAKDPIWDLEHTEGFEEHRDELKAFSDARKKVWDKNKVNELAALGEKLGADNLKLARTLERILWRLERLEEKIDRCD